MSDFNRMVYNHTIKKADTIKKICQPLHQQFGVKHFWYSKTTPEGSYFSLASNPEMHDYYHSSNLHLHSPFFHNPAFLQPGFYFYNAIKDDKFQESMNVCSLKHSMNFGGSMVYKARHEMIRYGYAFDASIKCDAQTIILNNLPLFQKFNEYFTNEAKTLINQIQDDVVDLPTVIGKAYNACPKGLEPQLTIAEKCAFLEKLGLMRFNNIQQLSNRELEIVRHIHEGLSARLIANRLFISPRTVEKHIESIKNKLNCFTKADLCKMAKLLHSSGFFN